MESPTCFDLETAIGQWRSQAAAESAIAAHAIAELEEHLHTGVDQLVATGLSSEEAFLIVTRRLGRTDSLAAEFHRADPGAVWKRRVFWILLGWVAAGDWMSIQTGLFSWIVTARHPDGSPLLPSSFPAICFLVVLVPVLVAIQLARGRLPTVVNRLSSWLGTKKGLVGCVLTSSGGIGLACFLLQRPSHSFQAPYSIGLWTECLRFFSISVAVHLPFALLLAWLMPVRRGPSQVAA